MTAPVDVPWTRDDGGRSAAGFQGRAGDCVTRAIAIAAQRDYREIYDALAALQASRGKARSARNGVATPNVRAYLASLGWTWTPTMSIGSGTTVHLRPDELPSGRLVVRLAHHVVAVIDGVVHDTYDPARGGTRAVYGYWMPPASPGV